MTRRILPPDPADMWRSIEERVRRLEALKFPETQPQPLPSGGGGGGFEAVARVLLAINESSLSGSDWAMPMDPDSSSMHGGGFALGPATLHLTAPGTYMAWVPSLIFSASSVLGNWWVLANNMSGPAHWFLTQVPASGQQRAMGAPPVVFTTQEETEVQVSVSRDASSGAAFGGGWLIVARIGPVASWSPIPEVED